MTEYSDWFSINNNVPKSAFAFYVKLYAAKRNKFRLKISAGQRKNILSLATDSYNLLSKDEKAYFKEKHKMYYNKSHNVNLAECLRDAEPFLLKKIPQRHISKRKKERASSPESIIANENQELWPLNISDDFNIDGPLFECPNEELQEDFNQPADSPPPILEPIPPFKRSKDLYCKLQSASKYQTKPWNMLAVWDKQIYSKALTCLKKEYIENYILYLQNLPDEKLFQLENSFE